MERTHIEIFNLNKYLLNKYRYISPIYLLLTNIEEIKNKTIQKDA